MLTQAHYTITNKYMQHFILALLTKVLTLNVANNSIDTENKMYICIEFENVAITK